MTLKYNPLIPNNLDEVGSGTFSSPLTTKGDIYTYSTTDDRLGVGSDGQVLTADSTQSTGVKWATPSGGGITIGSTTIISGIDTRLLFDDSGVVGEDAGLTYNKNTDTITISGTIELGDSSDTTLSRASAGIIAVEGINLVNVSASQTLTNKTLTSPVLTTPSAFTTGGDITLAENTSIALDPAGSADGKYSGITISGTAGATLAFGDLVYLAASDSRWELTDADADATAGAVMIGMCVLAAAGDGSATNILLKGNIRADAAFPVLTIGAPAYVSTTAGDIQVAQPSGTDDVIRIVGYALTADELYFNPSNDYITHT